VSTLAAEQVAGPGAVITCPQCHATIGRLRKSLYQHWTFGLDAIEFAPGKGPARNRHTGAPEAACQTCGTAYSQQQRSAVHGTRLLVHTPFGWLGGEPPQKPAPTA
jgi:hypothetical protein